MPLFVKFWGTRGSIPTPGAATSKYGGNTACVEIRADDTILVCDGGTGIRELGLDLLRRGLNPIVAHLFFSHAHWDHIQGFPFFGPAYIKSNTFSIYGTSGDRHMHDLLNGQMQSEYFPVTFSALGATMKPGNLSPDLEINGVKILSHKQWHPGASLGYAFTYHGKKIVYATDNELDVALENRDECEADLNAFRKLPAHYVDFIKNADLLIADGQYLDEDYGKKYRGYGHPRVGTVVDLAIQANVHNLAITHHDPMHTDREIDAKIEYCQARAERFKANLGIFGARESFELKLG